MKNTGEVVGKVFGLLLIALPIIALIAVAIFRGLIPSVQFANRPEQSAQVEVVGKRVRRYHSSGSKGSSGVTSYTYIVAFQFPDGSVKEFRVGRQSKKNGTEGNVACSLYDSIYEGNTGILSYKELSNIEKKRNEGMHWEHRRFISFEKDAVADG